MARRVKPYFLPARWMMMGGLKLPRAGKKSLLGEESLDEGLDDWECGDMGLASGEQAWCSAEREAEVQRSDTRQVHPGARPELAVHTSSLQRSGGTSDQVWQLAATCQG